MTAGTEAEIRALGVSTDVVTAGRLGFGLGRDKSRSLARRGEFPCPVIRTGSTYVVPVAGLLASLGLEAASAPGFQSDADVLPIRGDAHTPMQAS